MLLFSFQQKSTAQNTTTIWEEDFYYYNGTTTGTGNPSNVTTWQADGRNSYYSNLGVIVYNYVLRGGNTNQSNKNTWKIIDSDPIEISDYSNVVIEIDYRTNRQMEIDDSISFQYKTDNSDWVTFAKSKGEVIGWETARVSGLKGDKLWIKIVMHNNGNEYYYIRSVNVFDVSGYCEPSVSSNYRYINRVQLGTIDNSTTGTGFTTGGYADYTNLSTNLEIGETNISLTIGVYSNVLYGIQAWIDWDGDNEFTQTNDNIVCDYYLDNNGNNQRTYTFDVPSDATPRTTRMRVRLKYYDSSCDTPCENYDYGEVEDYTINIVNPCNYPEVSSLSATSTSICSGESTTLNLSGNLNDATYWLWTTDACDGDSIGIGTSLTVSPTKTTTYYAKGTGGCIGDCKSITINVIPEIADFDGEITNTTCTGSTDGAISANLPFSLNLNGSSQYVDLGASLLNNLTAFTIEGWIKTTDNSIKSLMGQNDALEFMIYSTQKLNIWAGGISTSCSSDSYFPQDNKWHHVAATGDGTKLCVYIDGALAGETTHSPLGYLGYGRSSYSANIGAYVIHSSTANYYEGDILKVGFWNRALSATEIANLASEYHTYTASESGLIAGYNFFEGTGTTISDVNSAYNGTTINNPQWDDLYTYSWTKTGDASFAETTKDLSNISTGEYNLTASNGVCDKTVSFTVTSNDTITPVANCKTATVYLDNNGQAIIDTSMINDGSSDNCSIDSIWVEPDVVDCSFVTDRTYKTTLVGSSNDTVTLTITSLNVIPTSPCTDATATYQYKIEYNYTVSYSGSEFSFHTKRINFYKDANVFLSGELNMSAGSWTGTTSTATRNESDCQTIRFEDLDCDSLNAQLGSNSGITTGYYSLNEKSASVSLIVQDGSGNKDTCSTNVIVKDTISPVVNCKDITVYLDKNGNAILNPTMLDNGSTDNCGIDTIYLDIDTLSCLGTNKKSKAAYNKTFSSDDGSYSVTFDIKDLYLIIRNNNCPYSCNGDIGFNYMLNITGGTPSSGTQFSIEFNCGNTTHTAYQLPETGETYSTYTTVTNQGLDCPVTSIDDLNCSDFNVNIEINSQDFSTKEINMDESFENTTSEEVTFTATDKSGNTQTCTSTVTLLDTIKPTIACPADITDTLEAGMNKVSLDSINLETPTVDDNCTIETVTNNASDSFAVGTTVVTWAVTDAAGNTNTCTQNVTIVEAKLFDVAIISADTICNEASGEINFPEDSIIESTVEFIVDTVAMGGVFSSWQFSFSVNSSTVAIASVLASNGSLSGPTSGIYTVTGIPIGTNVAISIVAKGVVDIQHAVNMTIESAKADETEALGVAKWDETSILYPIPRTGKINVE